MPTTIKVNLIQAAVSCLSKRLVIRSRLSASCVRAGLMISLFALELHHRLCRRGRIILMRSPEPIILMRNRGRIILMRSPEPMMRHSPNLVNPSQGANETPKCDKQVAFIAAYATATPVVEGPISGCLLHDRLMGRRSVAYGWGPLWPPVAGGRTTGHLSTTPGTHKGQYRLNKHGWTPAPPKHG